MSQERRAHRLERLRSLRNIRAAVVGTGFIGLVHVEALRRLGIEVTGIVGSNRERAAAKASAHNLPEPYESFEAMLADDRVDVVHLASPNHLHFEQARAVLEAGKHCVCEKPLAIGALQTAELVRLAEASGLVHATNFNIRFYPQVQEARERVAAGELGATWLVHGGYVQDWLLYETDWNWRLDPAVGGPLRAVADIGSHWIDLMSFVIGQRVEAVMADLTTFIPVRREPSGATETFAATPADGGAAVDHPISTEDAAGILLRFEGGARAIATISQVSAGRRNCLHFEIDGAGASVAWNSERPEELWVGRRDVASELVLRDATLMHPRAAATTHLPAGHAEGFADTFRELYRAVYAAVAAGQAPAEAAYPTFRDGHTSALVGEAIARSASEGRWVAVAEIAAATVA
jgi:predicted dehydrogenase